MQNAIFEQLIYENSAQKVSDILIQCVTKFNCIYAEVYRYSFFDNYVESILEINNLLHIRKPHERKDTLLSMPLLYFAVKECEPLFLNEVQLATSIPPKYSLAPETKSVAILPIQKSNVTIGFLAAHFDIALSQSLKNELIQFAEHISYQIIKSKNKTTSEVPFSNRELQTLQLIAEGWTTLEIAQLYSISEATVKHYVKTFMRKSNTFNRAHAVGYYMKHFYQA